MKPRKRKDSRSNVRQMQLASNAAREIVRAIANTLGWKIHETSEGISAYSPSKNLRIADHRTYMQTWVDNGSWNKPIKVDVVIEDKPTTGATMVKFGYDFTILEFIHQTENMTPETAKSIAFDLKLSMNGKSYANNARGQKIILKSTFGSNPQNDNQEKLVCSKSSNKLRLTESQFYSVISESVKMILSEINNGKYIIKS